MARKELLEFEKLVLEDRLREMKKVNIASSDDLSKSLEGTIPTGNDIVNVASNIFNMNQVLGNRVNAAGELQHNIKTAKIIDGDIDISMSVDYVRVGAYVILGVEENGEKTTEKYLLSHISDGNHGELLSLDSRLGSAILNHEPDEIIPLEGVDSVTYEIFELGWGFPVKDVEIALTSELTEIRNKYLVTKRSKTASGKPKSMYHVIRSIESKVKNAEKDIKRNQRKFEVQAELLGYNGKTPIEYIEADTGVRMDIRMGTPDQPTPNQLNHYHRIADQYNRFINGLRKLHKQCENC